MKLVALVFILFAFGMVKGMILAEAEEDFTFPEFNPPDQEIDELPGGCSGGVFDIPECIAFLANVFRVIGQGAIWLFQLLFEIVSYAVRLVVFLISVQFEGVDEAPDWINGLLTLPFLVTGGLLLYKLIRKGDDKV